MESDWTQQRLEQLCAHGNPMRTKPADMSYGDLIHSLAQNVTMIGRKEVALAKNEFQESIVAEMLMTRRMIIGAGFITLGTSALVMAFVMALAAWLPPWLTALIISILFIAAGAATIVFAWKHHVTLTNVQKELEESLKWSTKKAK